MESWNKKLLTAAKDGDIEALKLCLKNGADINYQDEYGRTALMLAASGGHLEICRLLIDTGCKIEITEGIGGTALMFAAGGGRLEICRLLIDRGCKIDITNVYGWTALMFAALGGRLEICRLLIDRGCKIEITESDGSTALHLAAREGYLQITRCLVEQGGASPLIKSHQGETPYDIAARRKQGQYKEVMEYLQTVMSEKSSGVTAEQEIKDDVVPTEIKLMADKRSIDLYLKLLESGSEKKRDIRLVVVGKQGAGKTSLIRRLFGEDITDVTSTNGIKIHKIKCKAMSDDGIWNKLDEKNEVTEALGRLLKEFEEQLQDKGTKEKPVESHMAIKDKRPAISYDESMKSETVSMQPKIIRPLEEPLVTPQQSSQSSEQAARDFETMLTAKSKVDRHDKEEYATFLLWDFAGDEEFYHTHQTFLSQDAMYLVVTKLNEADDSSAQALFRLWIDSIHCYSRLEEGNIISDDKTTTSGYLDPPIVIVGTWKDAVDVSEAETVEKAYKESLLKYTNELADDERGHLRCEYFISNKDDECIAFQQIRQKILKLARGMRTWNMKYPLKFIQLEQRLQEKKKDLPIISYQKIKDYSTDIPEPLSEEELILFLKFHHELRALVYFKDLSEFIILDTQWLSDAFRCIVTAQKFRINIRNQKEWNDFFQRGKLKNAVLEDIFKNETTIVYEHKDFILKVMEKFDIIIHPNKSEDVDENHCYYVPCMLKEQCPCDIYQMFKVPEDTRHRSTWLCFKFRFLPPHLKNHLIASLSRRYAIAQVGISNQKKMQIAIFQNIVVFELQKTKMRKLLVTTCPNSIQIQVLEFGKGIERGLLKDIADFVEMELEKIIHTRFNMSNVKFEKKWECGLTKPEFVTGINDFGGEQMTEYYCETCRKTHKFVDEWSGLQMESLCFLHCSNDAEHSNPHLEPPSKKPRMSTKIRYSLQAGMQAFSDVTVEPTRTGSLTGVRLGVQAGERVFPNANKGATGTASSPGFTNEEINFAKMGMIALNILADVLYDLLKPDKPNLRQRCDSDITYLYSEHRKLNKHVPTNGWGGIWQVDQVTGIVTGDDIERIRLTRNELQHSRTFKLEETRFNELRIIICELLKRFDHYNKPKKLYTDVLKDILAKTISDEDVKSVKNDFPGMTVEFEIEQHFK